MNSFFSESCTPPAVVKTPFMVLKSETAAACFMMIVASPDQNEHISRSAFDCWIDAICEVKSVTPSLGNSSSTNFTSGMYFLSTAWYVSQQS